MLAGAFQQLLKLRGLAPVHVASFGDYKAIEAPSWCVRVDSRDNATLDDGSYNAGLQIRTRASNPIAAENAGRAALEFVLAADGTQLPWVDPLGVADNRTYLVEAISIVNRPTWYATPEPGEETSCNLQLLVTEV